MEERMITCINCPVGCRITVQLQDGQVVSLSGNACRRGERYAKQECVAPERIVTAVVPVEGSQTPLSVKTRGPVPKALIGSVMAALSELRLSAPVQAGEVVLPDVCGSGVDVIATRSV